FFCRKPVSSAANRAACSSKAAIRWSIRSSSRSKSSDNETLFFPGGMICNPVWISRMVMEFVQMELLGCRSIHDATLGSGTFRISAERTLVSRIIIAQLFIKLDRAHRMPAQFLHLEIVALTLKESGDCRPQSQRWLLRCVGRIPQNVAHLLLHAAAITPRMPLQAGFDAVFQVADHKLGHRPPLLLVDDIMISH